MNRRYPTTILLVADSTDLHALDIRNRQIEVNTAQEVEQLQGALQKCGYEVEHLSDPQQLLQRGVDSAIELVFPQWFGSSSRNRKALLPAVCEAQKWDFVGADAFAHLLCNDKTQARYFARDIGFTTPRGVTLYSLELPPPVHMLTTPLVVKPALEGSSMGMTQDSLTSSADAALEKAEALFKYYEQPIVIEEFVRGEETCIAVLNSPDGNPTIAQVFIKYDYMGKNSVDTIFSLEVKKDGRFPKSRVLASDQLDERTRQLVTKAHQALGQPEMLRIDGRHTGREFVFIEFSTDINLGKHASFAQAFIQSGWTYPEIFEIVVQTASARRAMRNAKMK